MFYGVSAMRLGRVPGILGFLLALAALLAYRPVLRTLGFDLDRVVPEWAEFMTPVKYEAFMEEVRSYFDRRSVEVRILNGKVYPNDVEDAEYNLRYLAQKCNQIKDMKDWAPEIEAYFDRIRSEQEPAAQDPAAP